MSISKKIIVFSLFFALGVILAWNNFTVFGAGPAVVTLSDEGNFLVLSGTEIVSSPSSTTVSSLAYLGGVEDLPVGSSGLEKDGDYNDVIFSFSGSSLINLTSFDGVMNSLTPALVDESGTIYWGNPSLDGSKKNIGFCVLGGGNCSLPGAPFSDVEYFAAPSGTAEDSMIFDTTGSVTVTLLKEVTSYADTVVLGWYDPADPSVKHVIFDGPKVAGAIVTFTPSSSFVFYVDNGHGSVFSSDDDVSEHQHFALFGYTPTSTPTSTVLSADLSVQKTVDATSTLEGSTVHYTVTLSALGPETSTGVMATDILPIGLTFVNATSSQGDYVSSTGVWTVGDMPVSSTAILMMAAKVDAGTAGQTIVNTAVASESSSSIDQNLSNNSSTIPVVVFATTTQPTGCTTDCGGGGNLEVVLSGGGGGGSASYILTIDNGVASTLTTSATLTIYATGAHTMEISNNPSFANSTWIPYTTTMPWTLEPGAGTKTVYGRFRSVSGSDIGVAQDSIQLVAGQVLGISTSCGAYLTDYIRLGWANNPNEVKKLQIFLNGNLGTTLAITGNYNQQDFDAVQRFQVKYHSQVLAPWVALGLPTEMTPTGFVYQTTKWWINELQCESLNMPVPFLSVYQQ